MGRRGQLFCTALKDTHTCKHSHACMHAHLQMHINLLNELGFKKEKEGIHYFKIHAHTHIHRHRHIQTHTHTHCKDTLTHITDKDIHTKSVHLEFCV